MEGNLNISGANYTLQKSTVIFGPGHITTGKYYWEIDNGGGGSTAQYSGITAEFDQSAGEIARQANKSWLGSTAYKNYNTTSETAFTNLEQGTISFALDVDNRVLRGYYNNRLIYTDTTIPNASTTKYAPFTHCTNDGSGGAGWLDAFYNFGQRAFTFTPPEGYESLGSANISPTLVKVNKPKNHFDTLTYTGNGATSGHQITGLEFQPDFVWIKNRGQAYDHMLYDSIRGVGDYIESNQTDAEASGTHMDGFLSNGFSVGNGSASNRTNYNGNTYVGWCWKGGGAAVTNNDGSVTSTVSANQEAGFSIVTYTGSNDSTVTFGHGLGASPKWVWIKRLSGASGWRVYHASVGLGSYLSTVNTNAKNTSTQDFASVSSTTFGVKGGYNPVSANGETYVAYCWSEIPGYSKFGVYKGNNNSDGPFIYLGFRPAWVMIKNIDAGSTEWYILDGVRDPDNPVGQYLSASSTAAEATYIFYDFYNNGFKLKNTGAAQNPNNQDIIYMAFAEQPAVNQYGSQSNER